MKTENVFSSSSETSCFDLVILNFLGKQGAVPDSMFLTALGVPFSNEQLTAAHTGAVLYLAVNFRQKHLTFYGPLICKMCKNQQSEDC